MVSSIVELLPENYGFVVLALVGTFILNMVLGGIVSSSRKKYGVPYPTMYSDKSHEFNCIQRAHQNMLELLPHVVSLAIVAGLRFPLITAGSTALWILGRIFYARGYYTFSPEKRYNGGIQYFGYLGLLIASIAFALEQLGLIRIGF